MNVHEAEQLARSLMKQHGLENWRFRFDRSIRRMGICRFPGVLRQHGVIGLSRPLTEVNTEETVRDTILHEIAHAIVGPRVGHGPLWKVQARALGAKPAACQNLQDIVQVQTAWQGTCSDCGVKVSRRRSPNLSVGYTHRQCKYKVNKGRITWTYNGNPIESK